MCACHDIQGRGGTIFYNRFITFRSKGFSFFSVTKKVDNNCNFSIYDSSLYAIFIHHRTITILGILSPQYQMIVSILTCKRNYHNDQANQALFSQTLMYLKFSMMFYMVSSIPHAIAFGIHHVVQLYRPCGMFCQNHRKHQLNI